MAKGIHDTHLQRGVHGGYELPHLVEQEVRLGHVVQQLAGDELQQPDHVTLVSDVLHGVEVPEHVTNRLRASYFSSICNFMEIW